MGRGISREGRIGIGVGVLGLAGAGGFPAGAYLGWFHFSHDQVVAIFVGSVVLGAIGLGLTLHAVVWLPRSAASTPTPAVEPPIPTPSERAIKFYGKDPWSPEVQAERAEFMKREEEALREQLAAVPPNTGFYFGKTPGSSEPGMEIEGNKSMGFDHGFIVMGKPKTFKENEAIAPEQKPPKPPKRKRKKK